ncbi:MAG: hypothetical protein Q9207_005583 [Kuettlingeria erythrocarpa]
MQAQDSNSKSLSANPVPCATPKDTTDTCQESGLHVECEDNQLHLGKVTGNVKWLIADGFEAWNEIRSHGLGQYPPMSASRIWPGSRYKSLPETRPVAPVSRSGSPDENSPRCPFPHQNAGTAAVHAPKASHSTEGKSMHQGSARLDGVTEDPIAAEALPSEAKTAVSHTPSQAASASKCPIRFLDQHSPEEVAEYFQNHRHEIPRSHEICVKRFQRSDDQIKLLDHKYGSLANMLQGLGQKHQPLLHTRADGEITSQGRTSQEHVETWAHEVNGDEQAGVNSEKGINGDDRSAGDDNTSQRDGRFDRPLKEIRVGESPSRPWGISVPQAAPIVSVQAKPDLDPSHDPGLSTPSSAPPEERRTKSHIRQDELTDRRPKMIFTGPVFMGYSPDQITDILTRTGLGKSNSC